MPEKQIRTARDMVAGHFEWLCRHAGNEFSTCREVQPASDQDRSVELRFQAIPITEDLFRLPDVCVRYACEKLDDAGIDMEKVLRIELTIDGCDEGGTPAWGFLDYFLVVSLESKSSLPCP